MASEIHLTHASGLTKKAFVGWSWTSFFFGPIPAAVRGDWLGFFIHITVSVVLLFLTAGIGTVIFQLVWCAYYNRWHARRLIERGYSITSVGHSVDSIRVNRPGFAGGLLV